MGNLEFIALLNASWQTIYMVFIASCISCTIGLGLGILLFVTKENYLFENKWINRPISLIVNATRSIPFIILLISVLPFTRLLVGTTIGINAAIVPLTIAAIPFYARICESAFAEIPYGIFETANSLGVTLTQLVTKILIPESLPALIRGITLTIIGLIGYSAMAGAVGGGGLGQLAIDYGYQRFNYWVTLESVIILIVIVQLVQFVGDLLAKKRNIKPLLLISVLLAVFCLASQSYSFIFPPNETNTIRIGVMSGWPEKIMQIAQQLAIEKYNLHLQIVTFNDYVLPNKALADGSIDANIFQHVPYLEAQIKASHYNLVPIAKTFIYPMGFYSHQISSLSELKNGALIALPNDPSNEARALLLLQKAGLITLKPDARALSSLNDITNNPKYLQFKLLDAAQLPRVLNDATLVAITNDYVNTAGLTIKQALLKEGTDSLYANVIVVRQSVAKRPIYQELVNIMHAQPVVEATEKIFPHGAAIPAW